MRSIVPPIVAGLLAAFVAYSSAYPVIVQGLVAVGASPAEAASGVLALSIVMGACGIVYSWTTRMPMNIAWSSPGAAFLAASGVPDGGFAAAVGAFVVAGALTVAAGLVRPLARTIARFPAPLANAMLAGILFDLCLAPVRAIAQDPVAGGLIAATFVGVGVWRRLFAVPAAAVVAVATILWQMPPDADFSGAAVAMPVFVWPDLRLEAVIGLGLPLFLISMVAQNLPGLAIMRANGFHPSPSRLFGVTGSLTVVSAPFGVHSIILAAMTAALCAGEDAGPDRRLRYIAGMVCGLAYIGFGLSAGLLVVFADAAPLLIAAISGLALIGVFAASVRGAMESDRHRDAAAIAFLVTASGIAFFGISAAFWGLIAGGAVMMLTRLRRDPPGSTRSDPARDEAEAENAVR